MLNNMISSYDSLTMKNGRRENQIFLTMVRKFLDAARKKEHEAEALANIEKKMELEKETSQKKSFFGLLG